MRSFCNRCQASSPLLSALKSLEQSLLQSQWVYMYKFQVWKGAVSHCGSNPNYACTREHILNSPADARCFSLHSNHVAAENYTVLRHQNPLRSQPFAFHPHTQRVLRTAFSHFFTSHRHFSGLSLFHDKIFYCLTDSVLWAKVALIELENVEIQIGVHIVKINVKKLAFHFRWK